MATTQPTPQPPNPTTDRTGTELTVPTTSETATDLPILRRPSEPTDIGLIIGIVVIVIVVIVSVVTVLVIIAVLFKRRGNMVLNKKRGLSNPVYSIKGQCSTINIIITSSCVILCLLFIDTC